MNFLRRKMLFGPRSIGYGSKNLTHVNYINRARITVDKNPSLVDEAIVLSVEGLQAHQKITLHASTRLPNNTLFESYSHYIADLEGRVRLDRDMSLGGNFEGVEPMGPLSFMVSSPSNKRMHNRFMIKDPVKPFSVDFRILDSFYDSLESIHNEKLLENPVSLSISRMYMAPGISECNVWEGRIRGTLYLPVGEGPFPGVVSMSGGYPGAMKHKAALLASHGFAALALKYFGEDDLPDGMFNTDLTYIEEACVFLRSHPKVDGTNGVGIIANCFGGCIGVGLSAVAPEGLIRCVVSVAGWPMHQGTTTYKNKITWHKSKNLKTVFTTTNGVLRMMYDYKVEENEDAHNLMENDWFPYHKRFDTSYMFIVAGDDAYILDDTIPKMTEKKLRLASHPDYKFLYYPKAGHLIENSFHPFAGVAWTLGAPHAVGGRQYEHVKAQEDSWPKILKFTRNRLKNRLTAKF